MNFNIYFNSIFY